MPELLVEGRLIADSSNTNNMMNTGLRLASLPESQGGWAEYFDPQSDMSIKDPNTGEIDEWLTAGTANMMENTKLWMIRAGGNRRNSKGQYIIDEATRSGLVGGFSDYLFPVIRASFPTNPVNDLFSVQPTNRRTATVVYWNWIYGSTKGNITAGQRAFDANIGKPDANFHYSDNIIVGENTGTATVAATYTCTLTYNDGGGVVPGTVQLTTTCSSGAANFYDNGAGGFVATFTGAGTLGAATINYNTGAVSITIATETFTAVAVTANYQWGSEGSALTPQMDVQIITSTTETQRRALRLNYSMEAMFDVNAEFGVSLEDNLMSGCAEQLNYEIARQLISIVWGVAPIVTSFPITPPSTNYSKQQHFMDLVYSCDYVSNYIWTQTQKAFANWIIVDFGAANVIESMSSTLFEAAPRPANVSGVHFIGTLAGKYRIYKDVQLNKLPGASAYGNMLFGWKSNNFWDAGLVYAPYQQLYTTETLMTSDFLAQKGVASRYASKLINNSMYAILTLNA